MGEVAEMTLGPMAGTAATMGEPTAADRRRALSERMSKLHISRFSEIPRLDLYLDQLICLVSEELSFMRLPDEGPLVTGSMVNNYVKLHVLPPPVKHRYTSRHVAGLICICAFKRVFTIAQIAQVLQLVEAAEVDVWRAYDELCSALERSLAEQFSVDPSFGVPAVEPVIRLSEGEGGTSLAPLERTLEAAVVSLASKVYVDQLLVIESSPS